MQELRELVAQLRAENLRLRQEQSQASSPGPSVDPDRVPHFHPNLMMRVLQRQSDLFLSLGIGSVQNSMAGLGLG